MERTSNTALTAAIVVVAALALAGCGTAEGSIDGEKPILVDEIAETPDIWRLTLSEKAAERLDIQTTTIEADGDGLVVPSAAVIIGPAGSYWVYTNPEPLVYIRQELLSVHEKDHRAHFEEGPPVGTAVVTVGVPELYGAEHGIGK